MISFIIKTCLIRLVCLIDHPAILQKFVRRPTDTDYSKAGLTYIPHGCFIIFRGKSVRKLFPLILIVVAGCGSSGRNFFRPSTLAGCSEAPCDASFTYREPTSEVILNEYPRPETPTSGE